MENKSGDKADNDAWDEEGEEEEEKECDPSVEPPNSSDLGKAIEPDKTENQVGEESTTRESQAVTGSETAANEEKGQPEINANAGSKVPAGNPSTEKTPSPPGEASSVPKDVEPPASNLFQFNSWFWFIIHQLTKLVRTIAMTSFWYCGSI